MQNHFYSQLKTKSTSRLDQNQLTLPKEHDIFSGEKHYFLNFFEGQQQNGMQTQ